MSTILFLILLAVGGLLLIAAMKPNSFRLERSAVINATPDTLFAHINDLRLWNDWSPWAIKDPAMTINYSGAQKGVGAAQSWDGNRNVGRGRMSIIESVASSQVRYQLDFEKPMVARNIATFALKPEGSGTRITWDMAGPVSFAGKIMHTLFDMDKLIGADFETGLANLKQIAERSSVT
jgi:Polyketide cyclase / dehydrase and lipid transport